MGARMVFDLLRSGKRLSGASSPKRKAEPFPTLPKNYSDAKSF
jgi:hypothetical protein